jgi:hypothetical protein
MSDGTHLTTWVTRETKERFAAVARQQGLSDSALLKRLVELMLQSASAADLGTPGGRDRTARDSRLTVRIRPDDQLLLRERAAARGMAAATYVSVLTRSHLRSLAPLPKAEWLTLEKVVTELSKLGRNINQIARTAPGRAGNRHRVGPLSSHVHDLQCTARSHQRIAPGER